MRRLFAVGCYTPPQGSGRGVETFWFDGTRLAPAGALEMQAPSYLAWHPSGARLYAVNETSPGSLSEIRVDAAGTPTLLAEHPSGGSAPCHLILSPDARRLYVANYGDGTVAAFELDAAGAVRGRTDLATYSGGGPVAGRQDGSHAHMVVTTDVDRFAVVDLGTDETRGYSVGPDGALTPRGVYSVPPGTGPRQFVFCPGDEPTRDGQSRAIMIGELSNSILLVAGHTAASSIGDRRPATIASGVTQNLPAHLLFGADGRRFYVSNRGANVISAFDLDGDALRPVADYPCGGDWPRHMALVDDWLLVANQKGGGVAILAVDRVGGLRFDGLHYEVASPACVLPQPVMS